MTTRTFRSGIAALAAWSLGLLPAIAGAQITYQNDGMTSGSDGVVVCGFVPDEKFAALFVPDPADYPFTIDSVMVMLLPYDGSCAEVAAGEGKPVTIEIWNDAAASEEPDGAPVYAEEWAVTSSSAAINDLPVGDDATIRIESGVVRVAVTLGSDDIKPIRDNDGLTTDRNLIYDIGGTWHWSSDYGLVGDWLLRLTATHVPWLPEEDDAEEAPEAPDPGPDADEGDALDAGDLDSPADLPADADDADSDAGEDPGDVGLGGGGCACSIAA